MATVFLLAGVAKLVDGAGTRRAVGVFLPAGTAGVVAGLLPITELAVGVALLLNRWAWPATLVAMALLILFIIATISNLARGRVTSCGCFGRIGGTPSAVATLVRNEVLLAFGAFIVWQGRSDAGPDALPWLRTLPLRTLLVFLAVLVTVALAAEWAPLVPRLPHAIARLRQRRVDRKTRRGRAPRASGQFGIGFPQSGLPRGTRAPEVQLDQVDGRVPMLRDLLNQQRPVLLVFLNPGCAPCDALRPALARWTAAHAHRATVATAGAERCACDGTAQAGRTAYRVPAVPSGVLIEPDQFIGSPLAVGATAIEALMREIALRSVEQRALVAEPAAVPAKSSRERTMIGAA